MCGGGGEKEAPCREEARSAVREEGVGSMTEARYVGRRRTRRLSREWDGGTRSGKTINEERCRK